MTHTDDITRPQMTDEAIRAGSGKGWDRWRAVLDAWGAADKPHDEIARHLHEEHSLDGWWAQAVTVGYERIIGRRGIGERADGSFSTSASKTVPAGIADHFAAWVDEAERDQWLAPGTLRLRTAREGRSARFDDLQSGGIVALWFTNKGAAKSSVSVLVEHLPSKAVADERKAVWSARLAHLATCLKQR